MKLTKQEKLFHKVLGLVLKIIREEIGLTQVKVASLSGLQPSHICVIEKKGEVVGFIVCKKIAESMGSSLSFVVTLTEKILGEVGDKPSLNEVRRLFYLYTTKTDAVVVANFKPLFFKEE